MLNQQYIIDNFEEKNYKEDKSGSSGQKPAKNVGHRRITVLCLAELMSWKKEKET